MPGSRTRVKKTIKTDNLFILHNRSFAHTKSTIVKLVGKSTAAFPSLLRFSSRLKSPMPCEHFFPFKNTRLLSVVSFFFFAKRVCKNKAVQTGPRADA